jgi:hypothetical protein
MNHLKDRELTPLGGQGGKKNKDISVVTGFRNIAEA